MNYRSDSLFSTSCNVLDFFNFKCLVKILQTMQSSFFSAENVCVYTPDSPLYIAKLFKLGNARAIFNVSFAQTALIIAFVDAIAGIMFFTTPNVKNKDIPSIPKPSALFLDLKYTHSTCS
eukprot:NODE_252_length_12846_cov_0.309485.p14 type:complete len:120 gc:universal NODE_252_length_12846_cov_0.309485:12161-11802(-)